MPESGRIFGLTDRVRADIHKHVFDNPEREVGGVLVGNRLDGKVHVRGMIPALEAVGERAAVTFTHDAWEIVHRELDRRFAGQQIVGWYHSHPGFGIFLSRDDLFIHESFFSEPWQFAYVIDPIGLQEGEFGWVQGRVVEMQTRPISAPPGFRPPVKSPRSVAASVEPAAPPRRPRRRFPWAGTIAALVVGVLAGFLVAPAFGIGDSNGTAAPAPRQAKAEPGGGSPRSDARAVTTAPVSPPPPAPPIRVPSQVPRTKTPVPVESSIPQKSAPVEKEVQEYPATETGEETTDEAGIEAGGTAAPEGGVTPPGHFADD
jgi:proteasome lid subunit RPN8/RPN11